MSAPTEPALAGSALAGHIDDIGTQAAARCERWEVLAIDRADTSVEIGSGVADATRFSRETTVCLRVRANGRTGTATSTHLSNPTELVEDALLSVKHGPETTWVDRPPATPDRSDGPVAGDAARLVQEVCGLRTRYDIHGTITHTVQRVLRADRSGTSADDETFLHLAVVAEAEKNPRVRLPWTGWTHTPQVPDTLRDWLTTASGWGDLPEDVAHPAHGGVLLGPAAVHTLLTPLVTSLSATAAAGGRSFTELGKPLLHTAVDIRDEPVPACHDGTEGLSYPTADDNGVPATPLNVVENGRPAHLYHSVLTASQFGVLPTGHGFRGNAVHRRPLRPITPVLNNATLYAHGVPSGGFDDLLTELGSGIFVDSVLGGQQRSGLSPVVEGRIRLGFAVEHGKIVGIVRPSTIALDIRDVLGHRLAAISHCRWPVSRTWTGRLPFVLAAGRP